MFNDCTHERFEVRRRVNSANRNFYQAQCLTCGRTVGSQVAQAKVEKIWEVVDWDSDLERAGYEGAERERKEQMVARQEEFAAEQEERSVEWWDKYSAYLLTPKWKAKRDKVLRRDEHQCQACLSAEATEAHHLTYKHVFNEPLFDLIGVCHRCHRAITLLDRSSRASANPSLMAAL